MSASVLAGIIVERVGASEALKSAEIRPLILQSLRLEEAASLSELLGARPNDPYSWLTQLDFRRSEELLSTLHDYFAVPFAPEVVESKPQSETVEPSYTLFKHQRRAAREVLTKLRGDFARVLLHMPTGSGKTRTAVTTIADLLRGAPEGAVILWLAHSEELCDQAFDEAKRAWAAIGSRPITIQRHYGPYRIADLSVVHDGIVIAGLQLLYGDSLSKQGDILSLAQRLRLIVLDEAHQAVAPTYSHLINLLQRNAETGVLGLSATPGRSLRDVNADLDLASFFNRQKVKLEVEGYANPIDYLVAEKYLAKMDFIQIPFAAEKVMDLRPGDIDRLRQGFELPDRILAKLEADEIRNLLVIEAAEREVRAGGKVILFAMSVQHAGLLASVLSMRGVKAAAVTAATPSEQRRQLISKYRDTDEISVLCNFGVLTTGFDAPRTNVAIIARPTSSVVLYSQMIGRAARGVKAGGNETCRILTVIDRAPGFRSLADGFEFWDDIWEERAN